MLCIYILNWSFNCFEYSTTDYSQEDETRLVNQIITQVSSMSFHLFRISSNYSAQRTFLLLTDLFYTIGEEVSRDWYDEIEYYRNYFDKEPPSELKNPDVKSKNKHLNGNVCYNFLLVYFKQLKVLFTLRCNSRFKFCMRWEK